MNRNVLSLYREFVDCPCCHIQVDTRHFLDHIVGEHPTFFIVWASFNMPGFHTEANLLQDDVDDDLSYEYLMALCEQIGNHYEGVGDVDTVTTFVTYDDDNDDAKEQCPICLDTINIGRKTIKCNHIFCADCAFRWFEEHKKCPICIQDVTDQIASMSISAAPSQPVASSSSINTT